MGLHACRPLKLESSSSFRPSGSRRTSPLVTIAGAQRAGLQTGQPGLQLRGRRASFEAEVDPREHRDDGGTERDEPRGSPRWSDRPAPRDRSGSKRVASSFPALASSVGLAPGISKSRRSMFRTPNSSRSRAASRGERGPSGSMAPMSCSTVILLASTPATTARERTRVRKTRRQRRAERWRRAVHPSASGRLDDVISEGDVRSVAIGLSEGDLEQPVLGIRTSWSLQHPRQGLGSRLERNRQGPGTG